MNADQVEQEEPRILKFPEEKDRPIRRPATEIPIPIDLSSWVRVGRCWVKK